MCYYSSGTKKRGRSSSSSSMKTQYHCPNSKKPRIDYRKSFFSSRGFVGDHVGDRFSTDSKFVRVETVKKRFDRIIVKAEELQVEDRIRSDHQKVDSVEIQKKKDQILRKNEAYGVMCSVSDGGEKASKAARVEMLKKRFGRIIVKATEFQMEDRRSDHQKKVDPVEIQRKNRILEKKLKEAEIVAEAESKMELQRKREAAKKALMELERSVEVDDNAITMKDFTVMLGYPQNCEVYLCNEIGWYGAPVMVHSRRSINQHRMKIMKRDMDACINM